MKKEYSNGEVTVVWKSDVCIHAANCVKGLPEVFNPEKKPWIDVQAASTDKLIDQVKKCPSGALSFYMNDAPEPEPTKEVEAGTKIDVLKNGPLMVHGTMHVTHSDGSSETKSVKATFCRCGASSNKPYCDGAHRKINFEG